MNVLTKYYACAGFHNYSGPIQTAASMPGGLYIDRGVLLSFLLVNITVYTYCILLHTTHTHNPLLFHLNFQ